MSRSPTPIAGRIATPEPSTPAATSGSPTPADKSPKGMAEPLLKKTEKWGLAVGDEVTFEGKGEVVGFNLTEQTVEIRVGEGRQAVLHIAPGHVAKAKVSPFMKCVLQYFCGYMDIWFLRETFTTSFQDWNEKAKERVEKEAEWLFQELQMERWDTIHPAVNYTFGLYLRKCLAPSVYYYKKALHQVHIALGIALLMLVIWTAWGFVNLDHDLSDDEATARGVEAFMAVEHAPLTPLILVLCTHLIMMIFAGKQLQELFNEGSKHLPFPLTYTIIVGKVFMIFRMVMAYSSKNLGLSIDYFFWQELILITMHAVLAITVGDPSPRPNGPSYAKQLSKACLIVFGIDLLKTLVMVIFFCTFKDGFIAYYFNRLPSTGSMIAASVLVHSVLDILQTATTMFTMFIGRIFIAYTTDQSDPEWTEVEEPKHKIPDLAKQLEGQWRLFGVWNQRVTIELHHWNIQVPDRLGRDRKFKFPTVYELALPQTEMEVIVPQGMQAGEILNVVELRRIDQYSYKSFNADIFAGPSDDILPYKMFYCSNCKMEGSGTEITFANVFGGTYSWIKVTGIT